MYLQYDDEDEARQRPKKGSKKKSLKKTIYEVRQEETITVDVKIGPNLRWLEHDPLSDFHA